MTNYFIRKLCEEPLKEYISLLNHISYIASSLYYWWRYKVLK